MHWDAPEWCQRSVASLLASDVPASVTVHHNGGRLPRLPDGVRLMVNEKNIGYTGAANRGIREALDAGEKYVIVAAHDVIYQPDTIRRLVQALKGDDGLGIVGPTFTDQDLGGPADATSSSGDIIARPWASGACLAIRLACIRDIGLFDERLGSYSEDVDLGLRARDAGWTVGSVTGAVAVTLGSRLSRAAQREVGEVNAIFVALKRRAYRVAARQWLLLLVHAVRHPTLWRRHLGAFVKVPRKALLLRRPPY